MSDNRINELYGRYMDQMLSRREEAELAELLKDPTLQREWRLLATLDAKLHEEWHASTDAATPRQHAIRWPVWAPLATAAALLVTVGGFLLLRPAAPEYAMGRLTHAIGPLTISDASSASARITTIQTPSNSSCRLDQPDGTIVAVAEQSTLRWSEDRTSGARLLELNEGRTYLDVAAQKAPFHIQFPSGAQTEILGTRLLANRSGDLDFVSVLKGEVKIQHGQTAIHLAAGQTATPWISGKSHLITLLQGSALPETLTWLDPLDINPSLIASQVLGIMNRTPGTLDLSQAEIQRGDWRVNRRGDDITAIQEDPDTSAGQLVLGRYEWLRGRFSCKVRVLKSTERQDLLGNRSLHLVFSYPDGGTDLMGIRTQLGPMLELAPVLNIQADFEIIPQEDKLHIRRLEFWPEGHRESTWRRDDWIRTPQDTKWVKKRVPCALGVAAEGCSAEFFDFRLTDAMSVNSLPARDIRAMLGIMARYDFRGGSGARVPDLLGVNRDMDLSIGKMSAVERTPLALRVNDAADIALQGDLPSLRSAWAKNGGLTVELVMRPSVRTADREALTKLMLLSSVESYSWVFDGSTGSRLDNRPHHYTLVFDDRDGQFSQVLYVDGQSVRRTLLSNQTSFDLHKRTAPFGLTLSPQSSQRAKTTHPWTGDLVHMALYDRPLDARSADRLHRAWLQEAETDVRKPLGMIARYDFRGVSGQTIPDSSGVAPAMDLIIGKPALVEYHPDGLLVKGAADISDDSGLTKLKRNWAGNKGLTMEMFVYPKITGNVGADNARKMACLVAGDGSIAWIYDGARGQIPADRVYHFVFQFDDSSGKLVQHFYENGKATPDLEASRFPFDLHRRTGTAAKLILAPSRNESAYTRSDWAGKMVFMAVYDRVLTAAEVAQLHRAGPPATARKAASVRGELLPRIADYYKRHDQWMLQREKFTDGPIHATLAPAELNLSIVEGKAQIQRVIQPLKDGKTGNVLEIDNPSSEYCVTELRIPGDLPDAFAVEVDLLPVQIYEATGKQSTPGPFLYEGGYETRDNRTIRADVPGLPSATEAKGVRPPVRSSMNLGRWGQFRAEYLRVGLLQTGERVYELRLPQNSGPDIRITWKKDATIPMSFSGMKMRLGEIRVRRLIPPANPELDPAGSPAR